MARAYINTCLYIHTLVHTLVHTCVHACAYICIHTCMQTYIHIHTCMHTYMHANIHACKHTYRHSIQTYIRGFVRASADRAAVLGGGLLVCRCPVLVLHAESERRVVEAGGSAAVVARTADAAAEFRLVTRARLWGAVRRVDGHHTPSPAHTTFTP